MQAELTTPPRRRGMTLIELMVTMGLSMVLISAALSVFITLSQQLRRGERITEAQQNSAIALSLMQEDLMNVGWRYPNAGSGTGVLQGSDVLELATGLSPLGNPLPGRVTSVTPGALVVVNLAASSLLGPMPFLASETSDLFPPNGSASALNDVVMFSNAQGNACIGRVQSISGSGVLTVRMVELDYENPAAGTYYSSCPTSGMRAYRLGTRVRYLVCGPPPGPNVDVAQRRLYRQASDDGTGVLGPPVAIQDSIEDLQVSVRYLNPSGMLAGGGCAGAGPGAFCFCNDAVSGACDDFPMLSFGGPFDLSNFPLAMARGARVVLSAVGSRRAADPRENVTKVDGFKRPDIMDHPMETGNSGDGFLRVQQQVGLTFQNLMVVP